MDKGRLLQSLQVKREEGIYKKKVGVGALLYEGFGQYSGALE